MNVAVHIHETVFFSTLLSMFQAGLSEYSTMHQLSFMPLLPGPCASEQEANVRMESVPKVSFKSEWQPVEASRLLPTIHVMLCVGMQTFSIFPAWHDTCQLQLTNYYKHVLTYKPPDTCVVHVMTQQRASSCKTKASLKILAIDGCRLQNSPCA